MGKEEKGLRAEKEGEEKLLSWALSPLGWGMVCTRVWGCPLPNEIKEVRGSDTTHSTSHSWLQWSQDRHSELPTLTQACTLPTATPELGLFADVADGQSRESSSKEVMGY